MNRAFDCIINVTLTNNSNGVRVQKEVKRTCVAASEKEAIKKCGTRDTLMILINTFVPQAHRNSIDGVINSVRLQNTVSRSF
jgi:hypothetical protein